MKIIACRNNATNTKIFKLLHLPFGSTYETSLFSANWSIVDEAYSLLPLLVRNKMLVFEENERCWAKHKLKALQKLKALPQSDTTLDYCWQQANLVQMYGDDPLYRIATRLVDQRKFAYYDKYGLSSDVRRSILAFVIELGIIIE